MKVEDVIREVVALQEELRDVDGLSCEYSLVVDTNGDDWIIKMDEIVLMRSFDDYDSEIPLKEQIIKAMKDIQEYLNIVLSKFK